MWWFIENLYSPFTNDIFISFVFWTLSFAYSISNIVNCIFEFCFILFHLFPLMQDSSPQSIENPMLFHVFISVVLNSKIKIFHLLYFLAQVLWTLSFYIQNHIFDIVSFRLFWITIYGGKWFELSRAHRLRSMHGIAFTMYD